MKTILTTPIVALLVASVQPAKAQILLGRFFVERVKVVNMVPNGSSDETNQDSECNLAVNPSNTSQIAGSAFTVNSAGGNAPVYRSSDGGSTWELANIVPANFGGTHDIALAFGTLDNTLYAGILRDQNVVGKPRMQNLRTNNLFSNTAMTILNTRDTIDQPFPSAMTTTTGGVHQDHVFFANNDQRTVVAPRSGTVDQSQDARTAAPPAGITSVTLDKDNPFVQDMPPIRTSVYRSGRVYAAFGRIRSFNAPKFPSDIVVVRDDNFGTSSPSYSALMTGTTAGVVVQANAPMLFSSGPFIGGSRAPASSLAITVHPIDSTIVWIAWTDSGTAASPVRLHVRKSTNSGATWSADELGVTRAINPALAITNSGTVGVLYQQLNGTTWETHFQRTFNGGSTWSDMLLAKFTDNIPVPTFQPYLGDYTDLVAVGNGFYGTFASGNTPDMANFPKGVSFQRNADFTTHQLRNQTNTGNVSVSIDPFFFSVTARLRTICEVFPEICKWKYIDKLIIHLPPYPGPCLTCPPFLIPLEEMIREVYPTNEFKTALSVPYFHIVLDGVNLSDFEFNVSDSNGETVVCEINKAERGCTISFHPSKKNFNTREGVHGLKLTAMPLNADASKKGATFKYTIKASDYRFKEFVSTGN